MAQTMVGWFRIALLLFALVLPATLIAQAGPENTTQPRHGLMWNKTGLPGVFPLLVKTNVGENYVLLLSRAETGTDAFAAFIVGGRFFKVLVPPGTYRVRFAAGVRWQGEDAMFGRQGETKVIELPEALTFEVHGFGTKAGHKIDLTDRGSGEMAGLRVEPELICQRIAWDISQCGTAGGATLIGCNGDHASGGLMPFVGRRFKLRTVVC
ncbi:hypothetical protein [Sulfitobacter sp.]|uniref:hypothetical protein n=1 Tax=Sulfitobacter sp. TaxID=1903071 RepID=UPI00300232BE